MTRGSAAPRVVRWLEHPRAPGVVVVFALLLAAPSLWLGFFCDDHEFIAALEHRLAFSMPWWDLYRFTPGTPAEVGAATVWGEYPWWTAPELHLHFARPLPSALIALDHALFGRVAVLWHVHSLAWYAALLVAAGALFRRVLPRATASLALVVFAVSGANVMPFAWPSARHCTVAALFSALGLLAQVRWRQDGWRPGRWLGPAALVLGLLSGEAALGGVALAVAFELAGPSGANVRNRIARSLPPVGLVLAYLAVYAAAGCGARGSAGYLSPLSEPVAFLVATATRLPILLGDAILGIPAELSNAGHPRTFAVAGVIATALLGLLWVVTARLASEAERTTVRWVALGSMVATAAAVGGFPGGRELLVPNLGLAPIIAVVLRHGFRAGPFVVARRTGAGLLALAHVGLSPLGQSGNLQSMRVMARGTEAAAQAIVREADPHGRVRVLAASDPMIGMFAPAIVASEMDGQLGCWAWLSAVRADVVVERMGRSSFTLAPVGTTFLTGAFEELFRAPWLPLHVGDEQAICGGRVRVVSVEEARPSRIEVTTDEDLDAPTGGWLAWQEGGIRRVTFPPVGGSSTIKWSPGPSGMF